jgi:hypothetical protein
MPGVKSGSRMKYSAAVGLFTLLVLGSAHCGSSEQSGADLSQQAGRVPADPRVGVRSAACDASSAQLRWDYETVRGCERDEECNYVDGFYSLVPRQDLSHPITVFACQVSTPFLIVANGTAFQQQIAKLTDDQEHQEKACLDPASLPSTGDDQCNSKGGFVSSHPPICRAGTCQAVRGEDYYGG